MNALARVEPLDDGIGFVELITISGDDNSVVSAARTSYMGETKGPEADKKLLFYLMRNRHSTPFEFVEVVWRVKCPLFVARQWMRHRTFSFNEVSRRYTSEDLSFYLPSKWRTQSKANKQGSSGEVDNFLNNQISVDYEQFVWESLRLYNEWVDKGVSREMARMVLPTSLYTQFYAKSNLRNLLHFIGLRSDSHAQEEIRLYSDAMLTMIEPYVPWTVEAYKTYN